MAVPDLVLETVNENLQRHVSVDVRTIPDLATFTSLDMDSLDLVETLVGIENDLNIHFNERDYANFNTVGELRNITRGKYDTDKHRMARVATGSVSD